MRGDDDQQEGMFSYISPEKRVQIAAIVLIVWKKGVRFDAQHLKPQTA
jgi:hypothetical protein